jgi:SAM-dependent methyltransferase
MCSGGPAVNPMLAPLLSSATPSSPTSRTDGRFPECDVSPAHDEEFERFGERYARSGVDAIVAVEMEALGSDYQANGYTTRDQADELGRVLELDPGRVLLDIGAGCGWPGLYLAQKHRCAVISLDPVAEGVAVARTRALADGCETRAWAVQGAAEHLPIRPRSVDAVVHSDVLC